MESYQLQIQIGEHLSNLIQQLDLKITTISENIKTIENNIDNFFAFHFHGFEISNNFFNTGFCNYNKMPSKLILEKLYYSYAKKIFAINKQYNLTNKSIRNQSSNNIKKLRNLKFFFKKIFYNDFYKIN